MMKAKDVKVGDELTFANRPEVEDVVIVDSRVIVIAGGKTYDWPAEQMVGVINYEMEEQKKIQRKNREIEEQKKIELENKIVVEALLHFRKNLTKYAQF